MAGIGFELKKLFNKENITSNIKAAAYSTIVTIGPTLICMLLMMFFNVLLKYSGSSFAERELVQVTIMYSFMFSLILTGGYTMVVTRYIADKIFENKFKDIKASLYGALTLITIIGAIFGVAFYSYAQLDIVYKILAYVLFMELIIEAVLASYVTALKEPVKLVQAFGIGLLISAIIGTILILVFNFNNAKSVILSFDLGILFIILNLYSQVNSYFTKSSDRYFEFLSYFRKYKILFFINTFHVLGLYIHNIVFWSNSSINKVINNTYYYSPTYDMPAFFALITIMPSMVIFVVKMETSFFDKNREYFYRINNGACYKDIEISKNEMKEVLFKELIGIMVIQLICSLGFIQAGKIFLSNIGFTRGMIEIFYLLVLGYYCVIMSYIITTILLYFDDRKGTLFINFSFFILVFIFTVVTSIKGELYYGSGLFISGVISLIIAMVRVSYFIKNIDYYVFCKNTQWKN